MLEPKKAKRSLNSSYRHEAHEFLDGLFENMATKNLRLSPHWDIDHICFRVSTQQEYQRRQTQISEFSELLIESSVNGRPISTYRLQQPLIYRNWQIDLLELPAPKPGKPVKDGFEHIEVVCDLTFAELQGQLGSFGIDFDKKGLLKYFNPELEVLLGAENLKFHHQSLASVVRLESNRQVWTAISESGILHDLQPHSPLVAGAIPLGVHTQSSDVDILVTLDDFAQFESLCRAKFSSQPGFRIRKTSAQGEPAMIVNFEYLEVPFGIFGQKISSVQQQAWRHFQVEERLLKLGGLSLHQAIRKLREQGYKTEPAFAQALNLKGDPYLALAQLHSLSTADLRAFTVAKNLA